MERDLQEEAVPINKKVKCQRIPSVGPLNTSPRTFVHLKTMFYSTSGETQTIVNVHKFLFSS